MYPVHSLPRQPAVKIRVRDTEHLAGQSRRPDSPVLRHEREVGPCPGRGTGPRQDLAGETFLVRKWRPREDENENFEITIATK